MGTPKRRIYVRYTALVLLLLLCAVGPLAATPVLVGSFQVDQGPWWTTVPAAYTGQEAAALIFGGSPSDYWISIDPLTITHTAWYSTYGGACSGTFPCGTVYGENYVHNTSGLYQAGGDVSAYVRDWAVGSNYTNYVFTAAPEPATAAVPGAALIGLILLRRKRDASQSR
jgi:hypothetical protein